MCSGPVKLATDLQLIQLFSPALFGSCRHLFLCLTRQLP